MNTRKVTLSNEDIFTAVPVLNSLADMDLPVIGAYKLTKILMVLQDEYELIEKLRVQLIEEHGERDDNGSLVLEKDVDGATGRVKLTNLEEFSKKFGELLQQEHEIDVVDLSISELGDVSISVKDLYPVVRLGLLTD